MFLHPPRKGRNNFFESIKNCAKASFFFGAFEVKDIVCRMYDSNNYVCNDNDVWTCRENEKSTIVCDTAARAREEMNEELVIHQTKPLEQEVHCCSPNTSASVLEKNELGRYNISKEQARSNDFSPNVTGFLPSSGGGTAKKTDLQSCTKRLRH